MVGRRDRVVVTRDDCRNQMTIKLFAGSQKNLLARQGEKGKGKNRL